MIKSQRLVRGALTATRPHVQSLESLQQVLALTSHSVLICP